MEHRCRSWSARLSISSSEGISLVHMKTPACIIAYVCLFAAGVGLASGADPLREFELQALSPQFWKLVDRNAKLSVVATGFGFTEGPVWEEGGFLYVSDETLNKIFRVHP